MTTVQIRKKVKDYIDQADDRLLNMVYKMMQEYSESGYDLDEKTYSLLEKRRKDHLAGKGKSYTIKEVRKIVTAKKKK